MKIPEVDFSAAADYQSAQALVTLAFECVHPRDELRLRVVGDGATQVWRQCLDCGRGLGVGPIKKAAVPGWAELPPFDAEAFPAFEDARGDAMRRAWEHFTGQRRESYSAYLTSPEWREKRRLVMARAGGKCEGCGTAPAVEVHHLTYEHIGAEFLFELVAICHPCHERLHPPKDGACEAGQQVAE